MAIHFLSAKASASSRLATEDRAEIFEHGDTLVVVVADGAGGMRGGALASDTFVDAVRTKLARASLEPVDPYDLRAWAELFTRTDAELAKTSAGETTAVLVIIGPHGIAGLSAGDSEAWVVSSQPIITLTEDQQRQRLGSGRARPVPFHRRTLDGTLVVATDGLFKLASPGRVRAACSSDAATTIAERLLTLPRSPSGAYPDDVALVVVIPNDSV